MKVKISEQSIKHLVDNDCVDMVVEYIRKLEAENARLKAEVEELTIVINGLDEQLDRELDKSAMLCGQVMRLTKAGDDMAKVITEFRCGPHGNYVPNAFWIWQAWHTAKKGEQP